MADDINLPPLLESLIQAAYDDGQHKREEFSEQLKAAHASVVAYVQKLRTDAGLDVEAVLRRFLTEDGYIAECDIQHIVTALTAQPAAVGEAMVERIAALLYEEATGDPWTVAGVEHPEPDRDYYRRIARKVLVLAAQPHADDEVVFIDGVGAARSSIKSCRDGVQWIKVGDRVYWPLSDSDAKRLHSACCGNGSFDGPASPAGNGDDYLAEEVDVLEVGSVDELRAEIKKLRAIAGCAVLMADVHNAPEVWLDRLSEAANGDPLPDPDTIIDELLPYRPKARHDADSPHTRREGMEEITKKTTTITETTRLELTEEQIASALLKYFGMVGGTVSFDVSSGGFLRGAQIELTRVSGSTE